MNPIIKSFLPLILAAIIPQFVKQAEKTFGSRNGPLKQKWVRDALVEVLKGFEAEIDAANPMVAMLVDALIETAVAALRRPDAMPVVPAKNGGTGGVYAFPLRANGSPVTDPYAQRWPNNPMHDAEAQALYAPNDVVARLAAMAAMLDGGNFVVMPHGVGAALGDPEPVVIGTMDGTPLVPTQSPTA